MSYLRQKTAPSREKRLNALSAYYGEVDSLVETLTGANPQQRIRTFSQNSYDEILYTLRFLSGIRDAAVVIHGSRGCGASLLQVHAKLHWAVTDLNERDTIMGSESKLQETIRALHHETRAELIFVVSTPVVAINNDDIAATVAELQDELAIAIIPVYADGFRSRSAITGYDLAAHGIAKQLFRPNQEKGEFINLLAVSETRAEHAEIIRLLTGLGFEVNALPLGADLRQLRRATAARFSVSLNPEETDYLGRVLETDFGIPWLHPQPPIGVTGTTAWLQTVAQSAGLAFEAENAKFLKEQEFANSIGPQLFNGLRVYISLATSRALALAQVLEAWGATVVGLSIPQVDRYQAESLQKARGNATWQLHVAEGQPFEQRNLLKKIQPDLYLGGVAGITVAAALGIPAVNAERIGILGYQGINRLLEKTRLALENRYFVNHLAQLGGSVYFDHWYAKSVNWYIKQEVK